MCPRRVAWNESDSHEELLLPLLDGPEATRRGRIGALFAALGGLYGLARAGAARLESAGLRPREAERVVAALALGRRALAHRELPPRVETPEQAYACVAPLFAGVAHERFVVVVLDAKNRPLEVRVAAEGAVDACPVDPRTIFRAALFAEGAAVLVAHNHPSGEPTPSAQDLALTARLCEAGEIVGVPLVDHLVVGHVGPQGSREPFTSLARNGLLRRSRRQRERVQGSAAACAPSDGGELDEALVARDAELAFVHATLSGGHS